MPTRKTRACGAAVLLAALVPLLPSCSAHRPTGDGLPDTVAACETHNAPVCSTWTRTREGYHAVFDQGTEAELRVVRFDRDSVVLVRKDHPGPAPFTTAVYRGAREGNRVRRGVVTWHQSGVVFSGPWSAVWSGGAEAGAARPERP